MVLCHRLAEQDLSAEYSMKALRFIGRKIWLLLRVLAVLTLINSISYAPPSNKFSEAEKKLS
jgi:hypothetical protein